MQYTCKICNTVVEMKNIMGMSKFGRHLKLQHNISTKQYYETYVDSTPKSCAVCGSPNVRFLSILRRIRYHMLYKMRTHIFVESCRQKC